MELIAAALAAVQTTIALALLFLLPGLALGPILVPGARGARLVQIGRAVGVSLLTAATLCTLLAVVGLLRPAVVLLVLVAASTLPLAHPAVRRDLRSLVTTDRRGRRWWVGAVGAVALTGALVIVPSRNAVGDALLPPTSTVWYYTATARAMAEQGGLPATFPEWGAERPFPTDYLPATAHAAAAFQFLPGDMVSQAEWYRLAVLLAAVILGALLFRRWFSSWTAVLVVILLLATVRLEAKFLSLRPETFALALTLFAGWAADRALVERSARQVGLAVVAATLVFLSHAEVFLLLGPLIGGLAAGRLFVGHRGPLGLRLPPIARATATIAVAIAILGGAVVAGSAANAAIVGQFRILGYVAGNRSAGESPPIPADEMPLGWVLTSDRTWDFYVAAVAPGLLGRQPPHSFWDRSLLQRTILDIWPGLDGRFRGELFALAGFLGAPLLLWPWLDRRRRRAMTTWWVFGAALFAGSYLLFEISRTYVPMRVGPRRLMPYELLVPVATGGVLLAALDRLLRPGWRALLPRRGAMAAAGVALAIVTVGAVSPAPPRPGVENQPEESEPALNETGYDAYRWMAAELPADARILANAYTDGALAAVTRRVGILDGRAVYLENPDFLADSTDLLLAARTTFLDPDGPIAGRFLARERVSHIVVAGPTADGSDLGGYRPFDTDYTALAASSRFELVRSFADGRLLLYAVRPPA